MNYNQEILKEDQVVSVPQELTKQNRLDKVFLNIAKEVSTLSYCVRAKVGCVIVKNSNVISFGYNGTPSGMDNCCEETIDGKLVSKSEVLHAESNAILKATKMGFSTDGATMYVTLSPCKDCAKLIIQAGIKKVVYSELFYRDNGSVEFLKQFIDIEKYGEIL
jgi:dCMP deaminase